tara:strand:+ start:589 stop:792 length:204 start_codon:yes stop_codon:yes gene_type:complete
MKTNNERERARQGGRMKANTDKRYRVIKEFFVYAKDEYEAETKAEDKKVKLPWRLIDVQEIKKGEKR